MTEHDSMTTMTTVPRRRRRRRMPPVATNRASERDARVARREPTNERTQVVAEDLLELLGKAVTCAILGNAGPQRSRILGTLSKDERVHNLEQLSQ